MDELLRSEDAAPGSAASTPSDAQWTVQRQDFDDGRIAYEVWSVRPYAFLFAIYEDLTPAAKAIADGIVQDHNRRTDPVRDTLPLHIKAFAICSLLATTPPEGWQSKDKLYAALAEFRGEPPAKGES